MSSKLLFRRITWDELRYYLHLESIKRNQDVDQDVRKMTFSLFAEQTVEGFFFENQLVGFARWDKRNGHLSNLYVSPEFRGTGISSAFLNERPLKTLYVIPHNDKAIAFYTRHGFVKQDTYPTRDFMVRS